MRKWIALLLAVALLVTGTAGICSSASAAQSVGETVLVDSSESNYTPEYQQYLKDLENGDTAKYGGVIPRAVTPSYFDEEGYVGTAISFYDPRGGGWLTPAKNQGRLDTCWTFAANACLEAAVTRLTGQKQSFSEQHMRFVLSDKLRETNSSADKKGYYTKSSDTGGNMPIALAYLTNWNEPILNKQNVTWQAPVSSADVPYSDTPNLNWPQNMDARGRIHVTDTEEVEISKIKDYILRFGAVSANLYMSERSDYYNENYNALNVYKIDKQPGVSPPKDIPPNHAVTVVGWDDNFSKTKFSRQPEHDGAWLVKNSYGTDFGEDGYFWVSYEDKYFSNSSKNYPVAITGVEPANQDEKMLSYDFMPMERKTIYRYTGVSESRIFTANVFDFSELADEYGQISKVMFYAGAVGCWYYIYIKPLNADGTLPVITYADRPLASGPIAAQGYKTVEISGPPYFLPSNAGKYAVIVGYTPDDHEGINVYYEDNVTGHHEAACNPGESYEYLGESWQDIMTSSSGVRSNFCIRPILKKSAGSTKNSTIFPTNRIYRGTAQTAEITLNGNLLHSIQKNDGSVLLQGRDYTLSGNTITFQNSFLASLPRNYPTTLHISFSDSTDAVYTVNPKVSVIGNSLTGIPAVGEKLTASLKYSTAYPENVGYGIRYQWERYNENTGKWAEITGAANAVYTVTSADFGKKLRCAAVSNNSNVVAGTWYCTASTKTVILGDVNQNGIVSVADVLMIQNYLAGKITFTEEEKIAADFNKDGKIGTADVLAIQNHISS